MVYNKTLWMSSPAFAELLQRDSGTRGLLRTYERHPFSTGALKSAHITVTTMDPGDKMGHAEAHILPSLAA